MKLWDHTVPYPIMSFDLGNAVSRREGRALACRTSDVVAVADVRIVDRPSDNGVYTAVRK